MVFKLLKLINYFGWRKAIPLLIKLLVAVNPVKIIINNKTAYLRPRTNDINVYGQTFIDTLCEAEINFEPETIIDAGAHIGLTTLYYKAKYPKCKIISIEPDPKNFELLLLNTEQLSNVFPVHAGLWFEEDILSVSDKYNAGEWGMVTEKIDSPNPGQRVDGITINKIMMDFGLDKIDLIKIDIEGSEKEIFEKGNAVWISKTRLLVIELHDKIKEGCTEAFFKSLDDNMKNYTSSKNGVNYIITNLNYN